MLARYLNNEADWIVATLPMCQQAQIQCLCSIRRSTSYINSLVVAIIR